MPDKGEMEQAHKGILRLQRTYVISTSSIINGTIRGYPAAEAIHPDDYFHIGSLALKMGQLCKSAIKLI